MGENDEETLQQISRDTSATDLQGGSERSEGGGAIRSTSAMNKTTALKAQTSVFSSTIYDQNISSPTDIFPYREKFMFKVFFFFAMQIVFLIMSLTLQWNRWQLAFHKTFDKSPLDDLYIDRRCGIWDYLELYEDIGLYELIVIVVFGSIVLPFYRVSLYGLMQIMFYEGIGVSWYSRNDVNYQTSCEESELLPWMREDVKASFKSLPGRMKIATMMASTLENLMRFAFVQTCVNAFAITIFTTQTSENDETVSLNLRPEIMWGYVSVSLFSIVSAASVLVVRWEMNRWIRWYKRKTVVAGEASSRSVEPFDSTEGSHIEVAVVEDSITSLMEPLIQSEPLTVAEEVGNRNEDRQVESICSVQQILWYLAAAGCIVSWIAVVSGIDIFKLEYKSIPVPGEEYHWSRYSSVYDFTQDQYLYTYESPFAFRTIQFIAITVICFLIPSAIMMLCFVIEMRRDHLNNLWTRTLVCALQYFRFYNGGESILASFFVMYYEATRVMEGLVKIDIAGENFYLTAKFVLVPGTWFFMTFYVCFSLLHNLTMRKYKKYTLEI